MLKQSHFFTLFIVCCSIFDSMISSFRALSRSTWSMRPQIYKGCSKSSALSAYLSSLAPQSSLFSSMSSDQDTPTISHDDVKVIEPRQYLLFKEKVEFGAGDLGRISPQLQAALAKCNYKTATSIQHKTFDPILDGKNVLIGAETGSGKTLSYLIPLLQYSDS